MQLNDHIDKLKRYWRPGNAELKALVITCFLIAFMLSFREWGNADEFEAATGIANLSLTLLLVAISLAVHLAVQIIAGLWIGFKVEYKMWTIGLLIGLIVTVLSKGRLWISASI